MRFQQQQKVKQTMLEDRSKKHAEAKPTYIDQYLSRPIDRGKMTNNMRMVLQYGKRIFGINLNALAYVRILRGTGAAVNSLTNYY